MSCAPSLPKQNFSALTRLDHNRAKAMLAKKLGADVDTVSNVVIWGNHSSTQYPDINHGVVRVKGKKATPIRAALNNDHWVAHDCTLSAFTRLLLTVFASASYPGCPAARRGGDEAPQAELCRLCRPGHRRPHVRLDSRHSRGTVPPSLSSLLTSSCRASSSRWLCTPMARTPSRRA